MAGIAESSPPFSPSLMARAALLRGAFRPVRIWVRVPPRILAWLKISEKPLVTPLQIWLPSSHAADASWVWAFFSTPLSWSIRPRPKLSICCFWLAVRPLYSVAATHSPTPAQSSFLTAVYRLLKVPSTPVLARSCSSFHRPSKLSALAALMVSATCSVPSAASVLTRSMVTRAPSTTSL